MERWTDVVTFLVSVGLHQRYQWRQWLQLGRGLSALMGDIVSPVAQHACRPTTSSGQEILVGFSADETSEGNGPRMTSSCHCSCCVSKREACIFRMPR